MSLVVKDTSKAVPTDDSSLEHRDQPWKKWLAEEKKQGHTVKTSAEEADIDMRFVEENNYNAQVTGYAHIVG